MPNKTIEAALKSAQEALATANARITDEVQRLEEVAALTSAGRIQEVKRVTLPALNRIESYDNATYGRHWKTAVSRALEVRDAARASLEAQHAANEPAMAANRIVRDQVMAFMAHVGIKPAVTSYGYKTARAAKMTATTKTAGYVEDLRAQCPLDDGYAAAVQSLEQFSRNIELYKAEASRKEAELEAQAKKERNKRDQLVRLGRLADKYGVAIAGDRHDADEVLEAILSKDKYLSLSHAMEQVRNDWNDGPGPVEGALSAFEVTSDDDQALYDEVSGFVNDWDGDGRVFRDCKYNYGVLRSRAPDELLSDYDELTSLSELFSFV